MKWKKWGEDGYSLELPFIQLTIIIEPNANDPYSWCWWLKTKTGINLGYDVVFDKTLSEMQTDVYDYVVEYFNSIIQAVEFAKDEMFEAAAW